MKPIELFNDTHWFVYLLECSDGTHYCGVAKDVEARLKEHNAGRGSKYVRGRTPATIINSSGPLSHGDALRLELKVKKSRTLRDKIALLGIKQEGI
ncbi:MAG: GIY-YIG nuclease family protein [Deltaproteobacteria bacterium]|nr:GIY-YIG nuclease family protein [Deltaproteobacteria bacterium]